jgi:hypothetical protein
MPRPPIKRSRGLRSKILGDVLGIKSEQEQGTFTATETGAKGKAKRRVMTKGIASNKEY